MKSVTLMQEQGLSLYKSARYTGERPTRDCMLSKNHALSELIKKSQN